MDDLEIIYSMTKEFCNYHYPLIGYAHLDTSDEEMYTDDIHNEVIDGDKIWDEAVQLRAYVSPEGEQYPLTRWGAEQVRNVLLQVCVPHLVEAGLASVDEETHEVTPTAGPGDRFKFWDYVYEVDVVRRGRLWANSDVPLFYEITAHRFWPEAEDATDDRLI